MPGMGQRLRRRLKILLLAMMTVFLIAIPLVALGTGLYRRGSMPPMAFLAGITLFYLWKNAIRNKGAATRRETSGGSCEMCGAPMNPGVTTCTSCGEVR